MSKMMRAQVIEKPGKMVLKQVPVPLISDDEILIKVKVCGICGTDGKIFSGEYAAEYLPMTSGHEFWGVVEKAGKNAQGLKVGERVSADICLPCGSCYFCRRGEGLLCKTFTQLGIHTDGAFAEYVKAPWKNCYKIPDEVDIIEEVMKITDGIGADYVLEAVGKTETYEQAFKMVRRGGVVEAFGVGRQRKNGSI